MNASQTNGTTPLPSPPFLERNIFVYSGSGAGDGVRGATRDARTQPINIDNPRVSSILRC